MNPEIAALISLVRSAVNQTVPDPALIASLDYDALEKAASEHDLSAAVFYALDAAGAANDHFNQACAQSIRKNMLLDIDRQAVFSALDEAGIWHMALKGVVLKEYYPQIGMRQMADNDILFDASRAEDVRAIMESLGFETTHFGTGHQDDYKKKPLSHFEMHRMLFLPFREQLYNYYQDLPDRLIQGPGAERFFTHEDFYIYMIAHEYKHYIWRGTGLRSLLDVYVFLQRLGDSLDWEYLRTELDKIGIRDFESTNRTLAGKLFGSGADTAVLNAEETEMLDYIVSSGTFGSKTQGIRNAVTKMGKNRYIRQRIILPMDLVEKHYPFFHKHKILLPFLPLYRLVHNRKKIRAEVKALRGKKSE
ncbi:MAG: nucleotidyltransferase family protein [Lachnospiraceae bacterium]|nr:nucleotidyltransferase family protein [Lachnospiraceae bacterium]